MVSEIQHVRSRCGGGKSIHTLRELYTFLTLNPSETVVFASKTNKLTKQNHEALLAVHQQSGASAPDESFQRIDVETVPSSTTVRQALHNRLNEYHGGVVFISHEILRAVDATMLRHVRLIVDEVPSVLVQHLRVQYEHQDSGDSWESYIDTRTCPGSQYQIAYLDPAVSTAEVQRRIDNIRSGADNKSSKEVADLLAFLLEGHEVIYTTRATTKDKVSTMYLGTQWQQLEALVQNTKQIAILSAQLRDTLVGFVLEKVMQVPITPTSISDTLTLEERHQNRAVIYPLVAGSKWSSTLKRSKANESLLYQGNPVSLDSSVALYAQQVAHSILGGAPTLLILNNKDEQHFCWDGYPVERISSESSGMNQYTNYDHAVFLASRRPHKYEANALGLFAVEHGLTKEEIMSAVLTERCYEAAYQCIARTSVRNPTADPDLLHRYVVPDEAYAAYLLDWFMPGMATIDTTYLHTLKPTSSKEAREKAMFDLIVQIRADYNAGKGKLKDLRQQYGLNEKTYKRYVDKFRPQLECCGLLKPKRKPSNSSTTV